MQWNDEGEEVKTNLPAVIRLDQSPSAQLAMQSMAVQFEHALRAPRIIQRVQERLHALATADEDTAGDMTYALPRGGKIIEGASVRFAEALVWAWGKCRVDAGVIEVNRVNGYVEALGVFIDFETGSSVSRRIRRSILDKDGHVFREDMINVVSNAATAVAHRVVVLRAIPEPFWKTAWEASRRVAQGVGQEGLPAKRQQMLLAFQKLGVSRDRVIGSLGLSGESQITGEEIGKLRGMYGALKSREITIDEMFPLIVEEAEKAPVAATKAKPRTLADLAAENDESGSAGQDEGDKPSEKDDAGPIRERARKAYYRGSRNPPKDVKANPAWLAAWKEEIEICLKEEVASDDQDTNGVE